MKLPTNPEDEANIIVCCLLGGLDCATLAVETVPPEAFFRDDARAMFRLIESMVISGEQINLTTATRKWAGSGSRAEISQDLIDLERIPSAWNLAYYVDPVIESWRRRQIMQRCYDVLQAAEAGKSANELLEMAQAINEIPIHGIDLVNSNQASQRLIDDLEARHRLDGKLSGIATGFRRFDQMTDGLQKGELAIIAARPSIGKSAFGSAVALHTAVGLKIPTLIISLEMSLEAWTRRMLSAHTEITMGEIRRGSYSQADFSKFSTFIGILRKSPMWFISGVSGMGISQIGAGIKRYVRMHGIQIVILDYLQKLKPSERHEKRTYEVAEVSSALKALAEQTGTAFLVLAQLNREPEKGERSRTPRLSDLADSSQIERDADLVGMLHRDRKDEKGETVLIIAKQRDGETGGVHLKFNGPLCRFENPTFEHP